MGSVFVVGSINQDVVFLVDRRPRAGQTVTGAILVTRHGGKGANQAAAAAGCGASVRLLARVGDDAAAAAECGDLTRRGVDVSLVKQTAGVATGAAFVTVTPDGANAVVVAGGANDRMREIDVDAVAGHLAASDVLVAQFEVPVDVVARAVDLCGPETHVLLNAAPWRRIPAAVVEKVDTLVVNEEEAASLVGSPVDGIDGARRVATTILSRGPGAVVVTLGVHGAVVADSGGCTHLPAPRVPVVDTTGAGDAFVGSLAALLADGRSLREAAAIAVERASASIAFVGARAPLDTP